MFYPKFGEWRTIDDWDAIFAVSKKGTGLDVSERVYSGQCPLNLEFILGMYARITCCYLKGLKDLRGIKNTMKEIMRSDVVEQKR